MNGEGACIAGPNPSAGTAAALEGYLYQLRVSILIALDLLLARKVARAVILEPASREDLETDVEHEPGVLAEHIELDGYRLIIQCKLRSTGPWKADSLTRLFTRGTRRPSAASRLHASNIRYALVTNADVDGVARDLCIKELGAWPKAAGLPASLASVLPENAGGRIALFSMLDEEKVSMRTERLLTERFRVPRGQVEVCCQSLQQEALLRMRGASAGLWARQELESVVVAHGGFCGESPDLVDFVPPTNWTHLKQTLSRQHVVIITGPSGTGKTTTAKALIAELRDELPGATVVYVTAGGGPEKVLREQRRPVVFELEDPWGRFRLEPSSVPWNDAIDDILRMAGPARKFVITSRSDVLRESGPTRLHSKWVVSLEAENYRREDRAHLLWNQLKNLPHTAQKLIKQFWEEAVDQLQTPLELVRYVGVLAEEEFREDDSEYAYILRCIGEAHRSSIERSILHNVRKRNDWHWAAVVWGLFKAHGRLSFAMLPMIQSGLTQRDRQFEDELAPYVNFLIAGRHLRQVESMLSYQHPRVELGLERALSEKPQLASRALHYVVETLVSQDADPGGDWRVEGAVQLVYAVRRQPSLNLELDAPTQAVLDRWLQQQLAAPGMTFEDDLIVATVVGSEACPVAELARWLTHIGKQREDSLEGGTWEPPPNSAQWYEWIRADAATRRVCKAFIRRVMPTGLSYVSYGTDFVDHLRKLAPDATATFRSVARSLGKEIGLRSNTDAIAYGAIADLDAFESVVTVCLDFLAEFHALEFDDEWIAIANGNHDGAVEHCLKFHREMQSDLNADAFLSAYVRERRTVSGWPILRSHPRIVELLIYWIRTLAQEQDAETEELLVLADLAQQTRYELDFWNFAIHHWRTALAPVLKRRLLEGGEDSESFTAIVRTLALQLTSEVPSIADTLHLRGNIQRLLALAAHLGVLAKTDQSLTADNRDRILTALQYLSGSVSDQLADAMRSILGIAPVRSAEVLAVLQQLDAGRDRQLKLAQARALAACNVDVSALIEDLLVARHDSEEEIALVYSVLKLAIQSQSWTSLEKALLHRFATVREEALTALAARTDGPLPAHLLALATDESSRVRMALVKLLNERRHIKHTDALVMLAADCWIPFGHNPEHPIWFPIAWAAVQILRELPMLSAIHTKQIAEIAVTIEDPELAQILFEMLIRNGSSEGQQSVMSIAIQRGSLPHHQIAAQALVLQAKHMEEARVAQITTQQLLRRAPTIAVLLTRLVGARAAPKQIQSVAQALAANTLRRMLLIPLYLSMDEQIPSAKASVLRLLPDHITNVLEIAERGGAKIARDALDAFGDVDIVRAIILSYPKMFESSPEGWAI